METLVRADWESQEKRLGRTVESADAIQAALDRAARLREDLAAMGSGVDVAWKPASLARLATRATDLASLPEADRRDLYFQIRAATRQLVLKTR